MNYMLKILALVASLAVTSAYAADNAINVTNGSGVNLRSVDIGAGIQAPGHAIVNASGTQIGVSGSPLFIQGAASAFASGSFLSGAFAAGSNVDLLTMRGTVAAGTAASNALLTGCIYNSTPITLTNGQGSAVQCSVNGYPTVVVSNTLTALTPGDGITTSTYASGSPILGASLLWNSTTYDRWKSVATGVAAVGGTGTAGTAATNVLTVQGIAAMTPVQVSQATASNLNAAVVGTGTAGSAAGGVLTVQGAASMTPFLTNPGTAANWGLGATGAAVPANAVYLGFNSGGNLAAPSATAPLPVNSTGPYPIGATPYTATATGTTAATTATLAGASSVTTYICGFSIRANATAAATGNATVTGVITATLNFTQWTAPNASGLGITEMIFSPCIPASGTNQSVAVVSAAPGTGGVVSVTAWGYKL